jgi:predicted phosphodiesterase
MTAENTKAKIKNVIPNVADAMLGEGLLVIGDVHGKINDYWKLVKHRKGSSIQVGDFGFKKQHDWFLSNIDYSKNQINFGNHDDYSFLYEPHSLSDWSFANESKVMTVRGAYSIDKAYRTENKDWWINEELNYEEMQNAIDFYSLNKPKIMITHDCPDYARRYLFGTRDKSITSNGLQQMFESHQPDIWVFGHHHRSKNETINGTRFICLAELQTMVL